MVLCPSIGVVTTRIFHLAASFLDFLFVLWYIDDVHQGNETEIAFCVSSTSGEAVGGLDKLR